MMRNLTSFLFPLMLIGATHSAIAAEASTVDFANPIAWCTGERTSHYTIDDSGAGAGMLGIATQWKCASNTGHGSIGICQLDQTLKCRSDIRLTDKSGHAIDMSGYAVSVRVVTAKGTLFSWADAEAASAIVNTIQAAAAQHAAKNKAAMDNLGGEENFKQLLMASMCRYVLIKGGVVQPTAKEIAEDEQNKKSSMKLTVDTSPEHLAICKTTVQTFCGRTDLPASVTQLDNYQVLCGGARIN
ncbi:MAG: hypothetical protein ACLPWG_16665 [Steroidobacteraceae bacterium]